MPRQRLKTITCKPPRTGLRAVLCQLTAFFGLLAFAEYNGG